MRVDSQYQWPSGGAMLSSMWGPDQPDQNETCTHMVIDGNNNLMDDEACSIPAQYICEISKYIFTYVFNILLIWNVWVYETQEYSNGNHISYKFIFSAFNTLN